MIPETELKERFFIGSGKGGQHRNNTYSCVELVHVPTGLRVTAQTERSQYHNRRIARRRMAALLEERNRPVKERRSDDMVIRTRHEVDGWIKDEASGRKYPLGADMCAVMEDRFEFLALNPGCALGVRSGRL